VNVEPGRDAALTRSDGETIARNRPGARRKSPGHVKEVQTSDTIFTAPSSGPCARLA